MKDTFVKKIETEHYLIGSFDAYIEESKEIIKQNSSLSNEEVESILKILPTTYRATILDKNGNYVGYISIYNNDITTGVYSIRLETKDEINEDLKSEIVTEYKNWCTQSLNFTILEEEVYVNKEQIIKQNERVIKPNIIVPKSYLKEGIDEKTLFNMRQFYSIPNLQFPFTIVDSGRAIGIVGVSNLIWSTRRAQLQVFLNNDIDESLSLQLGSVVIDDYLKYLHSLNIHNVTTAVSGLDKKKIEMLDQTEMSKWADIPLATVHDGKLGSKLMYQDVPGYTKKDSLYVPSSLVYDSSVLKGTKEKASEIIYIDEDYRMVSPKVFDQCGIDLNPITREYAKCLENREKFTKPLGEDKYIPQIGNEKYGLTKAVANFTYVLLDKNNNFAGFVNNLRDDKENGNMEIELAINPNIHASGLGTKMVNAFYDEMFKLGYTSITSGVFSFNTPSLKLHQKVANFNGVRIDSYFINGQYFDMNYFTKVNPMLETDEVKKHR